MLNGDDLPPLLHGHYPASSLLRGSPPLSGASVLSASRLEPLAPFPLASPARFSRSIQEPGRDSRHLHAGCRLSSLRHPPSLESVSKLDQGLQSFRSMRRMEASFKNARALRLRFSQSLASRRQRLSHAMVRSTIQRLGNCTNPLA